MSDCEKERGFPRAPGSCRALVIGAGVSGCACGATLAARGVGVTLVNSALDSVGHPAFGPDLVGGQEGRAGIMQALGGLPAELRDAWLAAAVVPHEGPFISVDRRMLSIDTKRALEGMSGLEFRQGLADDLWVVGASEGDQRGRKPTVCVGTAFGEVLEAGTAVVAVGLSLGGCVTVGEDQLGGGRYGEAWSDGLRVSLEKLGARFGQGAVEVGPRFQAAGAWGKQLDAGSGDQGRSRLRGASGEEVAIDVPLHRVPENALCAPADEGSLLDGAMHSGRARGWWSEGYPESPYNVDDLWAKRGTVATTTDGHMRSVVSADGLATGEVLVAAEWEAVLRGEEDREGPGGAGVVASRLGHSARGLVVRNLDDSGRLLADGFAGVPIWITGRAAGASGYVESLLSGVRTGLAVSRVLGVGG